MSKRKGKRTSKERCPVCRSVLRPMLRVNPLDSRAQRICYVCSRKEVTADEEEPIIDDGQASDEMS